MPENAPRPIPEGMNTLTTHLWFNGNCNEAIEFYQKALGAELEAPAITGPDGKGVMHAMLKIGNSHIMMADAFPGSWEKGPEEAATAGLWVYVDDCDAVYDQAVNAGCKVEIEMMDAFWGDRMGKVRDPFGHCWAIASHKWMLTPEEMRERQEAWLKTVEPA